MSAGLHGALLALSAALVLGEGASWAALAGVACLLVPQRALLAPLLARWRAEGTRHPYAGLFLWLGGGALATCLGPYGLVRPASLAHLLPWLAAPVVEAAVVAAGPRCAGRMLRVWLLALALAVLFGAAQHESLGAWAEALIRHDRWQGEQGLRPGSPVRAMGGFYMHRLKMAHVLVLATAPLIARQLLGHMARRRRAAESALLLLFLGALGQTFARAAYLALGASVAGVMALMLLHEKAARRRLWGVVVATAAVGALTLGQLPEMRARLVSSGSGEARAVRGVIWSQALAMLEDHPLGIGLGNYPEIVGRYYAAADPLTPSPRTYAHSLWWSAWAEGGLLGAWGLAWFAVQSMALGARALLSPGGAARRRLGASWLMASGALFFVGLTHDVFFHAVVLLTFGAGLGLVRAAVFFEKYA